MKRRAILVASGAWLAATAARSFAQTQNRPRRVAVLMPGTQPGYRSRVDVFRAELKKLGYVEGRDISIEFRWADSRSERLPSLAAEIVALNPEVIVTSSSAGVSACRKATTSIPIVFTSASRPVEQGFVSSLRRPGGNVTGVMVYSDLTLKLVEIAREALPSARRLGILVDEADPISKIILDGFEPGARRFQFEPIVVRIASADDFDRAFKAFKERKAEAVLIPQFAMFSSLRAQLAYRALKLRLPLISINSLIAETGGLLSYGTLSEENYRRAAAMVDKILRGAKPAEMAVEQPERFHLIVNRKTAQAIGVTLSPLTMLRADRIID